MGNQTSKRTYNHLLDENDLNRLEDVKRSIGLISYILEVCGSSNESIEVNVRDISSLTNILDAELKSIIGNISPWLAPVSYEAAYSVFGGEGSGDKA